MPLLGTPAIQIWQEMDVIRCFINFDQRQVSPLWFMVVRVNELYCSFFSAEVILKLTRRVRENFVTRTQMKMHLIEYKFSIISYILILVLFLCRY